MDNMRFLVEVFKSSDHKPALIGMFDKLVQAEDAVADFQSDRYYGTIRFSDTKDIVEYIGKLKK